MDRAGREFLERSIEDLDRELAAGDLTPADHRRLRERYERRLRGEAPPPRPKARPGLVVASVVFVVVVAVAAGVLLARSAGRRAPGQTFTGNAPSAAAASTTLPDAPGPTLRADLARCTTLDGSGAIDCFTSYTRANPDDPDGFTQFGLFAISAGMANGSDQLYDAGEAFIRRALELDPGDVTARVYLAVVLDRLGRPEEAADECSRLAGAEASVPADLQPLVDLACT